MTRYGPLTLLNKTSFFDSGKLLAIVPKSKNIDDLNLLIFNQNIQEQFYLIGLQIGSLNMKCDSTEERLINSEFYLEVNLQNGEGKNRFINYTLNFYDPNANFSPLLITTIMFFIIGLVSLIIFTIFKWNQVKKMNLIYIREEEKNHDIYERKKLGYKRLRSSTYQVGKSLVKSYINRRNTTTFTLNADMTKGEEEDDDFTLKQSKSSYLQIVESEKTKRMEEVRRSKGQTVFLEDDDFVEIKIDEEYINADEEEKKRRKRELIDYGSQDNDEFRRKMKGGVKRERRKTTSVAEPEIPVKKKERRKRSTRLNLDVC